MKTIIAIERVKLERELASLLGSRGCTRPRDTARFLLAVRLDKEKRSKAGVAIFGKLDTRRSSELYQRWAEVLNAFLGASLSEAIHVLACKDAEKELSRLRDGFTPKEGGLRGDLVCLVITECAKRDIAAWRRRDRDAIEVQCAQASLAKKLWAILEQQKADGVPEYARLSCEEVEEWLDLALTERLCRGKTTH